MSIKQKLGESLRSYIDRFKKEELEVTDLNSMVSMHAAINGLQVASALKCSDAKTPSKTKLEFLKKAQKYIATEEALAEDHQEEAEHSGRPSGKKRKNEDHRGDGGKDNRKPSALAMAYSQYTPLNSSRTQILMPIGEEKFVKWPEKMKGNPKRENPKKYYKFHRGVDHDNEDCYELNNKIESLIFHGHLKQFVGGEAGASSSQ
ncbi:PREDICTED: uncharacterized protein LOC104586501 [Nelumbo nucifera]|uniref:Uncharacterized protein LOC104586501 n=1 Tax=Nelumbo nucifera TaxID=4432 RepID=A0A1U7YPU5_NELNU|nr:PREDICTED: uncharacterized protein LOC104586501 [Nelumbo nucifera]